MNYKEYWWKTTKETWNDIVPYLVMLGSFAFIVGIAILIAFLVVKGVEYIACSFGTVLSLILIIGLLLICAYIIFIIFDYRHYKKYVKDGIKE